MKLENASEHLAGDVEGQPKLDACAGMPGPQKRVCMIVYSYYESDSRVMRYAEALVQRGDSVEVFALRRNLEMPKEEVISGVRVFRIQDRFGKLEKSKSSFLLPALRFLAASSWRVMRGHRVRHYHLVHVHNVPDFWRSQRGTRNSQAPR